jgi:hemerythrin-like domain-containing protein
MVYIDIFPVQVGEIIEYLARYSNSDKVHHSI